MAIDNAAMNLNSDSECPDGTCPLKQPSSGSGYKVSESGGECRVCGGGRKRRLAPGSSTVMQGRGGSRGPRDDIKSGPLKIGQPSAVPTSSSVPAQSPEVPTSVVVPSRNDAPTTGSMVPVKPQPQLPPTSVVVTPQTQPSVSPRLATVLAGIGGGAINRGMIRRPGANTADGGPLKTSQSDVQPSPMSDTVIRPATTLSVPGITAGRGNGPRINLPEQKSVPVTPPPAPTSTVVTPKQQPEKAPLVLQPIVPLQPPPPDYCSDPRFAGTELCQRRGDGTFPALSPTCVTTLLALGSLDALRQHELCGPEVSALLAAGVLPTIGTPPKAPADAATTTDAKGMPIDVPGAVKIVAPGGAPVSVNGEKCLAAFLRLNPVVQQRIVGLFAQYPQARAVHGELARGVMDAPPTFVNWFRSAFSTGSPEASAFCAAVASAMQGVIPAGAPRGASPLGYAEDKTSLEACLAYLEPLPDTVTLPALRSIGGAPAWFGQTFGHLNGARDLVAGVRRVSSQMSSSDPNRWQALVGFLRSLCAAARAQQQAMRSGSQNSTIKSAMHPFQSGTASFRGGGYPLNIAIPSRTDVKLATRPAGDVPGAVAPGWEGVQSFTGQFGGNQGGAFGATPQGGLGQPVAPPTQTQDGLSTQQILGGIGQIGQTGLGFLNQYLDRESRDHLAELQANASSANARIAANASVEIARIQAQAQQNIAALGQNPTQQQVSNALNSSIPSAPPPSAPPPSAPPPSAPPPSAPPEQTGMSTGAKVGIGVAVAAVVAGGVYVASKRR